MDPPQARICCLDLDTFFVSVERILDPRLIGKPVVVGGKRGARGVVTACSYEVRPFGVRSGMSLTEAAKRAPPEAIFMSGTHGVYSDYSEKVRAIARHYTPESRVASIDEMYLDFRGCAELYKEADDADADATIFRVVNGITSRIKDELGLPASCGIASSKVVAKVASNYAKPAGIKLVAAGDEAAFLAPLGVRKLPGIGPVAERKLHALGLLTLGQVAEAPDQDLRPVFGAWTDKVKANARGQSQAELGRERPHFSEHDPSGGTVGSISNERTFAEDMSNPNDITNRLRSLTERVCWRARKRGVKARTVTLKLRYADFETLTRARTIKATNSEQEVFPVILDLYKKARRRQTPIRLLGLKLSKLGLEDRQLGLFDDVAKPINSAVDGIRQKFGYSAVNSAASIKSGGRLRKTDE